MFGIQFTVSLIRKSKTIDYRNSREILNQLKTHMLSGLTPDSTIKNANINQSIAATNISNIGNRTSIKCASLAVNIIILITLGVLAYAHVLL